MTIQPDIYYSKIITALEKKTAKGEEITRKDLNQIIIKYLNPKNIRRVVQRLREMGHITQEQKEIIKFIKVNN